MKITTILFDLDGTLIDTEPSAAESLMVCFGSWGIPLEDADAEFITGRTWAMAFEHLFKKYTVPVPRAEAEQKVLDTYRSRLNDGVFRVPGSVEAVQSLAASFPLAVVSGSHREDIELTLQQLGILGHFRFFLGAEDYPRSKPAPDGYLKAMQRLGARPEETLIFEDSQAGIASARAAGAWVAAITGTNHFRQNISQAHLEIRDLRGVDPSWVADLAGKIVRFSDVKPTKS